jgi:hypothetical protein
MKLTANEAAAATEVAQLARDMGVGYASHIAASRIAPRIGGNAFVKLIDAYQIDSVPRKGGTPFTFGTQDALGDMVANKVIREEFPGVWLTGALLRVGDALGRHTYFDHAAELELVYHLRNGVAHGNHFKFTNPGRKRLVDHPANNRACYKHAIFEITPALNGQPVLFDFMEAGDVLDLLFSVASHLDKIVCDEFPPPIVSTESERLTMIRLRLKSRQHPPESS